MKTSSKKLYLNAIQNLCFICLASILFSACVKGKGPNVSETRSVTGFTGINNTCAANIFVIEDTFYKVELLGQKNILDVVETQLDGSDILIKYKPGVTVSSSEDLNIYITAPAFNNLKLSGSGNMIASNYIHATNLSVKISGSGNMQLDNVLLSTLDTKISGSGNLRLGGTCSDATHQVSGSGGCTAFDLLTQNTTAKISGSGNMELHASSTLHATISGSGNIKYKGNAIVSSDISGSGRITKVN